MYNWNINTLKLQQNSEKYIIWKLEQCLNFGLNGEKLNARELRKYWSKLSIDPQRKKLLKMWLWPKRS